MNGLVNKLPQQAELTLATKQNETKKLEELQEQRCQIMVRIAIRTILGKQS